ncbi:MAG: heme-dependent oxidative N-demethylase subunit alpha family protein [Burkholderiaceae bacterium]
MPFDFSTISAPFRMQPGLRRIASDVEQLTPNLPGDRALQEKLAVLRDHAERALLVDTGFDATPALRALSVHAGTEHPQAWSGDALTTAHAKHLGWRLHDGEPAGNGPQEIGACLRALPPRWRPTALLALAFAEDFAVIDGASACIPWLAVCLPSRWAPEDKIGRHFAQVHAPVADNQMLIAAADHLARLVTATDRWERFVWTFTPQPDLNQHPKHGGNPRWPALATADELAEQAFFRTERQSFIPVPEVGQAIFTIHVESRPLIHAIDSSDAARRLRDALASMSPQVLAYRGLTDARERLLNWLGEAAAAPR